MNIVSETTARTLWPGQDAIGKHLKWGPPNANTPWHTVIGVVGDVKEGSLESPSTLHIYAPAGQPYDEGRLWFSDQHWVIRSAQPPGSLASAVRAAVASIDPQMPVANLETMDRTVDGKLSSRRIETYVIGLFAGAALLLAAIGIYGLIAYSVVQRTQEIGIRVALGATATGVVRLVLRQAVLLAVSGIAAGTVLSVVLARFIASLLFGVKATDVVTYSTVAAVLLVAAGAASLIPARRASRVDPMNALRRE